MMWADGNIYRESERIAKDTNTRRKNQMGAGCVLIKAVAAVLLGNAYVMVESLLTAAWRKSTSHPTSKNFISDSGSYERSFRARISTDIWVPADGPLRLTLFD